jgi:acetoacetate decarboxylase
MSFMRDGETVTATAARGGVEIIRVTFEGREAAPIQDALQHFINFKIIPSVEGGRPPEVAQLTDCPTLRQTHLLKDGKATLTLRSSASDPLGALPVRGVLKAQYSESDFTLPMGEVLHDYLAPPVGGRGE